MAFVRVKRREMDFGSQKRDVRYIGDSQYQESALRENCPYTEFFLVRIFPHLD